MPERHDEVMDVLRIMRVLESTTYSQASTFIEDELLALWRKLLIEWMYFVVDYCKLQRESVAAGAFFLDVAVSKGLVNTREDHQLAAATGLQLALKAFDTASIKLDRLVKLGRGLFTENDVVQMEFKILQSLDWHLHPPSTYCFLRQYERLLPSTVSGTARQMIAEVTKLISELTIIEHKYKRFPPSVVAYAGMLMALELIDSCELPISQRHCYVINMSTVAKLDCSSQVVLKAFEELKQSLDASTKLDQLIESIAAAHSKKTLSVVDSYTKSTRSAIRHSPRDVMIRLRST